jgi:quercetin dioxygenase-like cupin family protein
MERINGMSITAINIKNVLSELAPLVGRTPETSSEEEEGAFAELFSFNNGAVFTGSFTGDSPWERHGNGDEIVQVIAGETELTIMADDGPETLSLSAGSMTVVPKGLWHRFHAPDGVSLLTATPQPTDHTTVDDPRDLDT